MPDGRSRERGGAERENWEARQGALQGDGAPLPTAHGQNDPTWGAATGLAVEGDEFDALLYELQRSLVRALGDPAREWEADYSGRPRISRSGGGFSPTPTGLCDTGPTGAETGVHLDEKVLPAGSARVYAAV
jgi:hypothetical protein